MQGIQTRRRRLDPFSRWLLRGTDLGGEGFLLAAVTQPREHVHRSDTVRDAVMKLHQHGPAALCQTVDDPAFPKRAIAIQAPLHDIGSELKQFSVATRVWKCRTVNVMGELKVRVVHPARRGQVQNVCTQHLPEPWNGKKPVGKPGDNRIIIRYWALNDGQTTDRKTDVAVGILCFRNPASSVVT